MTFAKGAWFEGTSTLQAVAESGTIVIGDGYLRLGPARVIPLTEIGLVSVEALHGMGTVVRIDRRPESVILFVTRLNLAGRFVIVNRLATLALSKELQSQVKLAVQASSE